MVLMITEYVSIGVETKAGRLQVRGSEKGILGITFTDRLERPKQSLPSLVEQCVKELEEYCAGDRKRFTVPLVLRSTDFQQAVWDALLNVPFGSTVTYGELAERTGHPGAARAVGNAVHDNPITIIVPCHRVLPASGGIGEYASGADKKEWLLRHEGVLTPSP